MSEKPDNLHPMIPSFILDHFRKSKWDGHFPAAVLVVDIKGYTAFTKKIMSSGSAGAETISELLNDLFSRQVTLCYSCDGFIPFFAGDSYTVVFSEKGKRLPDIQALSQKLLATIKNTRLFKEASLSIKLSGGYGDVYWHISQTEPHFHYFYGDVFERAGVLNGACQAGDILLEEALMSKLSGGETYPVDFSAYTKDAEPSPIIIENNPDVVSFLPELPILTHMKNEFREVISAFISFDFQNEGLQSELIDSCADLCRTHKMYVKELDCGDKGIVLFGFFGAPVSHIHQKKAAIQWSLACRELLGAQENSFHFKIAMSSGRVFSGFIGGPERCQYAAVGHSVNCAARYLSHCPEDQIIVDRSLLIANTDYRFLTAATLKGMEDPIDLFCVQAYLKNQNRGTPLFGREKELHFFSEYLHGISEHGTAGHVWLQGPAGIGKSRLIREVKKMANARREIVYISLYSNEIDYSGFLPLINYLRSIMDVGSNMSFEIFAQKMEQLMPGMNPIERKRITEVFALLLDLHLKGNFIKELDARTQFQIIKNSFVRFFEFLSDGKTLLIKIDDLQWIDFSTVQVLLEIDKKLEVHLLLCSRPLNDEQKEDLEELLDSLKPKKIILGQLNAGTVEKISNHKLGGPVDRESVEYLYQSSDGNPFYLEQIIDYLKDTEAFQKMNSQWSLRKKEKNLKRNLQNVLLSRIDRLVHPMQEAVKYASVLGQEFEESVFSEMMSKNGLKESVPQPEVNKLLSEGMRQKIWKRLENDRLVFSHALLRDAAYDMQMQSDLKIKHLLAAEAIEDIYKRQLNRKYFELLYHYEKANKEDQLKKYLFLSGEYSQKNFRSRDALRFYDRYLELEQNISEQLKVAYRKYEIFELMGKWSRAMEVIHEARELAFETGHKTGQAYTTLYLGQCLTLTGDYEEAGHELDQALSLFRDMVLIRGEIQCLDALGNLFFRQSKYKRASTFFEYALKNTTETEVNLTTVGRLGLTYMNLGKHNEGIQLIEGHLKSKDIGRLDECALSVNLGIIQLDFGDFSGAEYSFHNGMHLSQLIGNRLFESIAYGSLGGIEIVKGNARAALTYLEKDKEIVEQLGDKQGQSIVLGLYGEYHLLIRDPEQAQFYFEKQLEKAQSLGYTKGMIKAATGQIHVSLQKKDWQAYDKASRILKRDALGVNQMSFEYYVAQFLAAIQQKNMRKATELRAELEDMATQLNTDLARFYVSWMNKYLEHLEKNMVLHEAFIFEQGAYSDPAYLALNKRLIYALTH